MGNRRIDQRVYVASEENGACEIGGVCEGESLGHQEGKPLTLMRYYSCGLLWLYEALESWMSVCGHTYNLTII